jgi:hypothetical protein
LAFLLLVALSASLFLATRAKAEAIAGDGSRPAVQAGRAARRETWVEARPGGGASFRAFLPGASQELHAGTPDASATASDLEDDHEKVVVDATPS